MLRRILSAIRNCIWPRAPDDQPATSSSSAQGYQQVPDQPQQRTVSEATPPTSTQECHHMGQFVSSTVSQERLADQPATTSPTTQASQQLPKQPQERTSPEATPLTGTQEDHHTEQFVLNEITLGRLAKQIGAEWEALGRNLGIKKAQIDRIKADYPMSLDRIFQMLLTWLQQQDHSNAGGGSSALEALCKALEESDRKDLVPFLKGLVDDKDDFPLEACRAEFIRYYKEVMGVVPLLPWLPSEVSKINDIYVNLNLEERVNKAGRVLHCDIDSYEDMLRLTFDDGQAVRFILLSGIAGSGKTTIISKIANDWAQETPGSPLSKFSLLVALSMRELKSIPDLTEAIFDQILPKDTKLSRESLTNYLKSHSDEVLVILDGADEFDEEGSQLPAEGDVIDIISNKILRGCTVIVTTRPHMVDKLCRLNPYFTRVETLGFSDKKVMEYTRNFFKEEDPSISDELHLHLEASERLHDMARTPMMLLLICLVWSDEHKLPETLTELFKETFSFILKRHFEKYGQLCPEDKFVEKELTELVQTLGKAALDGVMLPDQKLVFKTLEFGNSKMVEKACSLGILSQEKVRSKLHAVEHVTFFHKTIQEAIAGFYWADLVESDEDLFSYYLSQVNEGNAQRLEYLMRFCCGRNVKAARCLLSHITDTCSTEHQEQMEFGSLTTLDDISDQNFPKMSFQFESITRIQRIWLLLHLEAGSKDLHSIAIDMLSGVLQITSTWGEEETTALEFLANCAISSSRSFLTELKRVCICSRSIRSVTAVSNLLRHSTIVTDVGIHFVGGKDVDWHMDRWQVELADAISGMQSLLNLKLCFHLSEPLDVSVMFNHLAGSHLSRFLQCFVLIGVHVNSSCLARFINKQRKLCKICLNDISESRVKSPSDAACGGGLQSESLKLLVINRSRDIALNVLRLSQSYPNLEVLGLSNNDLREEEIQRVSILLLTTPKLREVDLSGNVMGNTFPCLAEQLSKLGCFEVLKLNSRMGSLSSGHIVRLANDILPRLANLRVLSLACPIDPLMAALYGITKLGRTPDGSTYASHEVSESVTPEALLKVVQWSCKSSSIQKLNLPGCVRGQNPDADESVRNESVNISTTQAIHETHHSSIETLNVSYNLFGLRTASFIRLLKQMPSLKNLYMLGMGLTNSDAVILAEILQRCDHIQDINLGENKVGSSGLEALLRVLPKLTDLKFIVLPDVCDEPTEMVRECFECIKRQRLFHFKFARRRSNIQALVEVVQRY